MRIFLFSQSNSPRAARAANTSRRTPAIGSPGPNHPARGGARARSPRGAPGLRRPARVGPTPRTVPAPVSGTRGFHRTRRPAGAEDGVPEPGCPQQVTRAPAREGRRPRGHHARRRRSTKGPDRGAPVRAGDTGTASPESARAAPPRRPRSTVPSRRPAQGPAPRPAPRREPGNRSRPPPPALGEPPRPRPARPQPARPLPVRAGLPAALCHLIPPRRSPGPAAPAPAACARAAPRAGAAGRLPTPGRARGAVGPSAARSPPAPQARAPAARSPPPASALTQRGRSRPRSPAPGYLEARAAEHFTQGPRSQRARCSGSRSFSRSTW